VAEAVVDGFQVRRGDFLALDAHRELWLAQHAELDLGLRGQRGSEQRLHPRLDAAQGRGAVAGLVTAHTFPDRETDREEEMEKQIKMLQTKQSRLGTAVVKNNQ